MVSPVRRPSSSYHASPSGSGSNSGSRSGSGSGDNELLHSLNKLSITTSSSAGGSTRSPRSIPLQTPPTGHFPSNSSGRRTSMATRSPSSMANHGGPRSGTPTLARKSSTTSLRSARPLSRKSSANNLRSPNTTNGNSPVRSAERAIPTEASVAREYLKRELEMLHSDPSTRPTDTIIILHDACYGHRFSRPRATKSTLSTIVERPERIQASILGVSAAYVRLGERHCDGKVPIHPDLDPTSLPSIPFRILKTDRSLPLDSPAVTNVHGTKWMDELKAMCESAETKLAANGNELRRPDTSRGNDSDPPQKLHEGDLYLCPESQNAFEGALGAVCEAVDTVFSDSAPKRAFVAVRPPGHHCSASHPSGFCWVNNVQVGIMHGVLTHGLTHAAIIDFDLHHGDGSQGITWAHNKRGTPKNAAAWKKTSIGYFSLHDINSYPCEWGDEEKVKNASLCIENAHGQNIWNVHLQEWKTEVEFWKLYQSKYSVLLEKARNFLRLQTDRFRAMGQVPKAAIFLSAGFDASEWEGVGMQRHKVNVPTEFYARITRDVVKIAGEEGLGVDGRVISVLEGGYSDRALYSGVLSHLGGLAGNDPVFCREEANGGLAQEMSNMSGSFSRRNTLSSETDSWFKNTRFPYDPNWWSTSELDKLDGYTSTTPVPPKLLKIREGPAPTYSSPTQASEAKLTEIAKIRRSLSGTSGPTSGHVYVSRAPTPPPPEVPWMAAAHELSKLLIPSNRQIGSCKHEELNPEAAKPKRERQSLGNLGKTDAAGPLPSRPSTRMSLRERKPTNYADPDSDIDKAARRRTVGGALATEKAAARGKPVSRDGKHLRQPSRRLSTASNMSVATHSPMDSHDTDLTPGHDIVRPATSASFRTARPQTASGPSARRPRPATAQKEGARVSRAAKPKTTVPAKTESTSAQAAPVTQAAPTESTNVGTKLPDETSTHHAPANVPQPSPDASGELDNITSGMKRIKINVLTKEKKESRQREAAEKAAASKKAAEAQAVHNSNHIGEKTGSPVHSAGGSPRDVARHSSGSPEMGTPSNRSLPSPIPTIYEAPAETQTVEFYDNAIPSIVTTPTIETHPPPPAFTQSSSPPATSTNTPTTPDLFVPYQPDGPTPESIPISGPVRILDPNTGTPAPATHQGNRSPKKAQQPFPPFDARSLGLSPDRQGQGHGFTATSPIPFATAPPRPATSAGDGQPNVGEPGQEKEKPKRVWEVKETPQLRRQL